MSNWKKLSELNYVNEYGTMIIFKLDKNHDVRLVSLLRDQVLEKWNFPTKEAARAFIKKFVEASSSGKASDSKPIDEWEGAE